MTKSIDDKISLFEAKLKQLKEQKKLAENRARKKSREQERKNETRKKILIGAMFLQRMKFDKQLDEVVISGLDKFLKENRDRQLFNLGNINPDDPG